MKRLVFFFSSNFIKRTKLSTLAGHMFDSHAVEIDPSVPSNT